MSIEYTELKLDLTTALSMLEDQLSNAEAWEVYARIELLGEYEEALLQMRELAARQKATDVIEMLTEVSRRVGLVGAT